MSGFSVVYVRLNNGEQDLAWLQKEYGGEIPTDLDYKYARATKGKEANVVPTNLKRLSNELKTNAQYFGLEPDKEQLFYEHWKEGNLVRALTYNVTVGWEKVEGTPELWEADFFSEPLKQGAQPPDFSAEDFYYQLKVYFGFP
ncbi:hypothetical protein [Beggiatoa leptomitoformis]|uniref:Uncharacterized protein n=1 Tax=Beggiatoa leptomitoformis TaxID=288004 RepID=A0A2N9YH89_9GAMM|nr:hypothetical protein [Beggiatoa leptomitoformis]ALG68117.1 hypothetical protein AL038_10875 [Beggiatoa leptomitoformis]AUI69586.1 hypothetical protein BLE401_13395 [Beggiatoa leptomitoformis]